MEKQFEGKISTWIAGRGFGFAVVTTNDRPVKYYCHISRFPAGSAPVVGQTVRFNLLPVKEGRELSAVDLEIVQEVVAPVAPLEPTLVKKDEKAGV